MGPHNPFTSVFCSSWPAGLSGPEPCFQYGLFASRAAACTCGVHAQTCFDSPLKKSPYVAPTLQLRATIQLFPHPTSPGGKKSFLARSGHSLLVLLTALGDRISLLNSLAGNAAIDVLHTVCVELEFSRLRISFQVFPD